MAVMLSGRIVEYGPAQEVFLAPKHAYTQALLAAAPRMR
jgi:ABC-type dipeptide/oligopeptide/nickel transport system ATPase component